MDQQVKPKRKLGCLGIAGIIIGALILIGIISALANNGRKGGNVSENTTQSATQNTGQNQGQQTTPGGAQETTQAPAQGANEQKIEFKNILLQNELGMTTVIGEVVNNDNKAHSFTLKVSFYDKDNKLLGTAVGAVNDLNGGETKIFSALATEDYTNAASYKVQVDTLVSSGASKKSPVEFSNVVIKTQVGMTTVDGEAKNIDTAAHSFTVVVGFYDKNGKLIGSATGAVNDLPAGETKTFSALATGDYSKADKYKVQVDTLVQ